MSVLLSPGESFAGCTILAICGEGTFGTTYLAADPLGRQVIIKLIDSRNRSRREVTGLRNYMRVAGKHPNLLRIQHIGESADGFYYLMEAADNDGSDEKYLPATLTNRLKRKGRPTPEEALAVLRELLDALRFMHAAGLVHRDIKPDNIIFVNGKPKLSDPGLVAEADSSATFAGTLGFIPPEAVESGRKPHLSDDLYALGKVFYCMLTGFSPDRYPELPADLPPKVCRQLGPLLNRLCGRDPKKRFQDAANCLKHLPAKLTGPSPLDRVRERFRAWRSRHRKLCRLALTAAAIVLLWALVLAGMILHRDRQERRLLGEARQSCENYAALHREHGKLVALQLEAFLPEALPAYRQLTAEWETARDAGDWFKAAELSGKLRTLLAEAAEQLAPAPPVTAGDLKRDFDAAGQMHSFLAAPLAAYWDTRKREDLRKLLKKHEQLLYRNWSGLRCGQDWTTLQEYYAPLNFVPAGAVRLKATGEIVKIPYHFWLCRVEQSHELFTFYLDISPQQSPVAKTPAERVVWNDVLLFCRTLTELWQMKGLLPPGYIIRPPTEAEWEYAAGNAWLGDDTVPFAERAVFRDNSNGHTHPCGSLRPNRLGLFDIYGNVAELVLPQTPSPTPNFVVRRGGSFRTAEKQCYTTATYLKYQNIPPDIGFRIAVAPGDMDFFDRHFFARDEEQYRTRGKVYELLGGNVATFSWDDAGRLCRLLGGRLAEFEDPQHLEEIRVHLPLTGAWNTAIGGRRVDGEWRWLRGGRIDWGKWKTIRGSAPGGHLALLKDQWRALPDALHVSLVLCEWDEADYDRRNDRLRQGGKLPFEVMRFTVNDRQFVLFQAMMFWYTAERVCSLLGGRLACLDTPEVRDHVIEAVKDHRSRGILLGGLARWKRWYWLSGKEIATTPEKGSPNPIPTRNQNFVMLQEGQLRQCFFAQMFLCEWPAGTLPEKP